MLWRGCPDAAYGVSEAGSEGGSGISGSPFLPPSPSQKSCVSPRVRAGLDRKAATRGQALEGGVVKHGQSRRASASALWGRRVRCVSRTPQVKSPPTSLTLPEASPLGYRHDAFVVGPGDRTNQTTRHYCLQSKQPDYFQQVQPAGP